MWVRSIEPFSETGWNVVESKVSRCNWWEGSWEATSGIDDGKAFVLGKVSDDYLLAIGGRYGDTLS